MLPYVTCCLRGRVTVTLSRRIWPSKDSLLRNTLTSSDRLKRSVFDVYWTTFGAWLGDVEFFQMRRDGAAP